MLMQLVHACVCAITAGMRCLQLPEGVFSHTPQLEQLIASRAGLSDFPAAVLDCTSLKRLDLSSNSLSSMPLQVTQLTRWVCIRGGSGLLMICYQHDTGCAE